VAILDADKEGFLRSEGSLIQTIAGRRATSTAARSFMPTGSPVRSSARSRRPIADAQSRSSTNVQHRITPRTASRP